MANKRLMVMAAVASSLLQGVAQADETHADDSLVATARPASSRSERDVHVGLNFRTDFGARYYRADLGVRLGRWDVIAVLDPLGAMKGDYDNDVVLRYAGKDWSVWGGGRLSITPIGREAQYTEKALVGISAQLPKVFSDKVRIHSGLELAVHMHAHGGDIMTRWVCVDSPACREDHFVFGLFGRVEYASSI